MAIISGTSASPKTSTSSTPTNLISSPVVENVSFPTAGTEQSVTLPVGTLKAFVKVRGSSRMQISFTSGDSGTTYFTIYPGDRYEIEDIKPTATITLYIQCSKSGETLEVERWS